MANPVETKAGLKNKNGESLSVERLKTAASIRYNIYRLLLKGKISEVREFVTKILNTDDTAAIEAVSKAVLKRDKNATKMLIMAANPRTWTSYYVNEYFRDALKKILNGQVATKPDYIDSESFRQFCIKAMQYRDIMRKRYGWKFVTNVAPEVVEYNGDKVVGAPDFVAVDSEGRIHVVNVHTMEHDAYHAWGHKEINFTNGKLNFSIQQERSAYAAIQARSLQEKPFVSVSSTMLLPVVVRVRRDSNRNWSHVDGITFGETIPVTPSDKAVSKYSSQEDELEGLKTLIKQEAEKASNWSSWIKQSISTIKEFRVKHKTKGYLFKKNFDFEQDGEPKSVAEAFAQLDRIIKFVDDLVRYKDAHIQKELDEINKVLSEDAKQQITKRVSEEIAAINKMDDETRHGGIVVDIAGGEDILNNADVLTEGKVIIRLATAQNGAQYIQRILQYKEKEYKLNVRRRKVPYGAKNGGMFEQTTHPAYTRKMKAIESLLINHPNLVVTIDLKRSHITYAEKSGNIKPVGLTEPDSVISSKDIDNLGVQQNDGKIVDIGFYDKKTGIIQSGARNSSAVLGRAPEGEWWQNQLFLVIKQNHDEKGPHGSRTTAIPIVKSKFTPKIAAFIAQCYRVLSDTNAAADAESTAKRKFVKQMLSVLVGKQLIYRNDKERLPNVVYTSGDGGAVNLNGSWYLLSDDEQFKLFVKELQKLELMPSWDTFNVKLRNLANSEFQFLYTHFSTSDEDFAISIDGVDSGLRITKQQYENDTLSQWFTRSNFFATRYFVSKDVTYSIHNLQISTPEQKKAEEKAKEPAKPLPKEEKAKEMNSEEFQEWLKEVGGEVVEEDEEDASYDAQVVFENPDYADLKSITSVEDAFSLIRSRYRFLERMLRTAMKKTGTPRIQFNVLAEEGQEKVINGVSRHKKGTAKRNEDGSWTITLYANARIKTLAHEMVHVFTLGAIEKNTKFAQAVKILYSYCKETLSKEELQAYGFTNVKEFVAEFFVNPELINILKTKGPVDKEVFRAMQDVSETRPKNIFQQFVQLISNFLFRLIHGQLKNTTYGQVYRVMVNLLENPEAYSGAETVADEEETTGEKVKRHLGLGKKRIRHNGYTYKNHITRQEIHFDSCQDVSDLRAAVDGIMTMWIEWEKQNKHMTPLGSNIEKLKFSQDAIEQKLADDPDFLEFWNDNIASSNIAIVREIGQITFLGDESKETVVIHKTVGGKRVGVRVKKEMSVQKWAAIAPIFDEFMSDMRLETRKKIELIREDQELMNGEEGETSKDIFHIKQSYEISPFDRASREVKWFFSTVPYEDTSHNKYGMRTFIPFQDVYGKVLYYTQGCTTTQEVLNKLLYLSEHGPNKQMFKHIYEDLNTFVQNIWRDNAKDVKGKSIRVTNEDGKVFDVDMESLVVKIIRSLRQQQNDFIWATTETKTTNDGERTKDIDIKTTLYEKGAIIATQGWADQLTTGASGLIVFNTKTNLFEFQNKSAGNAFRHIYNDLFEGSGSFLSAYDRLHADGEDVGDI